MQWKVWEFCHEPFQQRFPWLEKVPVEKLFYLARCFHLLVLTWFNLTTTQFNCQACF
uniref:Uncharacterized protein n=1 Tax=Siphoviridae sp. ctmTU3 TaxID=2826453 RepID=A0A8S5NI55_9CAUD|nr:MAG TPA: hypothetical protein [Siphoviridae sp. ctmTU3]